MLRLIATVTLLLLLGACTALRPRPGADEIPQLRLSPSSLGRELALQQRLEISSAGGSQTLEALLEVDKTELRLAAQVLGQSVLTLRWDGQTLRQQRADGLPPQVDGERVLSELQLVFWPTAAIQAALPAGWQLREDAGGRRLLREGQEILDIRYPESGHAILSQLRAGYRLDIRSVASDGVVP